MITHTNTSLQNELDQCVSSCEKNFIKSTKRLFKTLKLWSERAEERKQLAKVDERLLKDMGLSRLDADQEAARPFWR